MLLQLLSSRKHRKTRRTSQDIRDLQTDPYSRWFYNILHLLFLGFGKWKMHKDIRRLCLIASLDASELSALVDPWSVTYCYPASLGPWKDAIGARKRNCSTFGWFHSRASANEVDEYLEHCDWIRSLPLKKAGKDSNFKRLRGFTSENPELHILCHSRFKQLNPSVKYDPQWRRPWIDALKRRWE